jgi:hypothetical protein
MGCGENTHKCICLPTIKKQKINILSSARYYPNDLKMLISVSTLEEIYPLLASSAEPDSDFISSS